MTAPYHRKAVGMVEKSAARQERHGLFAGIDQIVVFLTGCGRGSDAKNAVFTVQNNFPPWRNMVGNQCRLTDTQIDDRSIKNILRYAGSQFVLAASGVNHDDASSF
jgi:hypothetical protein